MARLEIPLVLSHPGSPITPLSAVVLVDTTFFRTPSAEFLDWLVLSEARFAVVTADSTFGGSARARSGYFNGRWDLAVVRDSDGGAGGPAEKGGRKGGRGLRCERVSPGEDVCGACVKVGPLCPREVRAECA